MKVDGVGLDLVKIARARANGCKRPIRAYVEAKLAGIPYRLLCAVLEKESAGGSNVFGHDPTIFVGAGRVTRRKYLRYKEQRQRTGKMQGVGPMQLTWWEFQDEADRLGGCWHPKFNIRVGARLLAKYWRESDHDIIVVGERYNGAREYGRDLAEKTREWGRRLNA